MHPRYITLNISGGICTSDYDKRAVVVMNKSRQHRFWYTGRWSEFWPYGICTVVIGHILVCDSVRNTVHIFGLDGGFLSFILSTKQGMDDPRGVCGWRKQSLCGTKRPSKCDNVQISTVIRTQWLYTSFYSDINAVYVYNQSINEPMLIKSVFHQ